MKTKTKHRTFARITGAVFLAYFACMILSDVLGRIGFGAPEVVYRIILDTPRRFNFAIVLSLVSSFLFLATAWGLYRLFKPTHADLAAAFLILNAVGTAIHCASLLPLMAAFRLTEPEALIAVGVYKSGFASAQLFFGTWLFPLGYLVRKSGILPRILGILLILDGLGVLIWFFQSFLLPDLRVIIYPGLVASFVAEFSLALWLLLRGVRP